MKRKWILDFYSNEEADRELKKFAEMEEQFRQIPGDLPGIWTYELGPVKKSGVCGLYRVELWTT